MKPVIIRCDTEFEFWKRFIEVLQLGLPTRNRLSPKEVRLMAYILSQPVYRDCFKLPYKTDTIAFMKMSYHNLHMYRHKIAKKGWISDKVPDKKLLDIQKQIKDKIANKLNLSVNEPFTFEFDLRLYNGSGGDNQESSIQN